MEMEVLENHHLFQDRGKQFMSFLENLHIPRSKKEKWKGFVKKARFFNQLH